MTRQTGWLVLMALWSTSLVVAAPNDGLLDAWTFRADRLVDGRLTGLAGRSPLVITGQARFLTEPLPHWHCDGLTDEAEVAVGLLVADLPTEQLTVSAWVSIDQPTKWGGIVSAMQDNGSTEYGWLLGYNDQQQFTFAVSSRGADDGDGKLTYLASDVLWETGRWHHVAATYDGATMRIYVDGRLAGESREQSGDILYPAAGWYQIGAYRDDDEFFRLNGRLHEVQVHARALAADEIALLAEAKAELVAGATSAPQVRLVGGPWLQQVTGESIVIMAESDLPCQAEVVYGTAPPYQGRAASAQADTIHEVRLTGLQPGTGYYYQMRLLDANGSGPLSKVLTFQTAAAPGQAVAFAVVGDHRTYPDRWARIAALAWAERPHFVLNVGDVVTNGSNREEWLREWILPAGELMQRSPMYVAIGNHERNSPWYYRYVSYPEPENYYSFDYGDLHIACLDSNADLSPGSEQYRWLEADLAASAARWKMVACHHPPFSSDDDDYGDSYTRPTTLGDPKVRALTPLFERAGVDIVWYGHIHSYERTWPIRDNRAVETGGVVYIQTGGGGAELERFAPHRSWFTAKVLSNWQYCLVNVLGGTLRMCAYDIDGRLYDYLELRK